MKKMNGSLSAVGAAIERIVVLLFSYVGIDLRVRIDLHKAMSNFSWLFVDRIVRIVVSLFLGVWMARYLGASGYGALNYAISFVALFGFIATLGFDGIVIRDLVRQPDRRDEILGSAFVLKSLGGFAAFAASLSVALVLHHNDSATVIMIAVIAAGFFFQTADVVDFWFQSQVQSKYVVIARFAGHIAVAAMKITFILTGCSVVWFAVAATFELAFGAFGLMIAYRMTGGRAMRWKYLAIRAIEFLRESWALMAAAAMVVVYMKIDQVMLKQFVNDAAVGIYSVAIGLVGVAYFIPSLVSSSVFPAITKAKKISIQLYLEQWQSLYNVVTWIAIFVAIVLSFFSDTIIVLLYGKDYVAAAEVLKIYAWTFVTVSLGVASGQWLILEGLTILSFLRTFVGFVVNIALNILMIPKYAAIGAAIAALVSQGCVAYLFGFFVPKMRYTSWQQTRSLLGLDIWHFIAHGFAMRWKRHK